MDSGNPAVLFIFIRCLTLFTAELNAGNTRPGRQYGNAPTATVSYLDGTRLTYVYPHQLMPYGAFLVITDSIPQEIIIQLGTPLEPEESLDPLITFLGNHGY